jgi:hypothetical protein
MTPVSRSPRSFPVLAATLVVLVVAAVQVVALVAARHTEPGPPLGAVLDGSDRRSLAALPVRRGPPPPPAAPTVDLADPSAVARAYLVGARTVRAGDGGHTHLGAAGYAAPGSPPATVGVLVLDPPPAGQVRTAAVTALELVATDDADQRRAYRASVATTTGPPGTAAAPSPVGSSGSAAGTAYVVLARQPDGRWLVTADTPDLTEGDD